MKRLGIDYDRYRNCFKDIENVRSKLIWGDKSNIPDPWFSYIIPVYKRADLLEETLRSVLNQKKVGFAWDIVVVDNEAGGENDTERLIRRLNSKRILYYRNDENIGPDGNYNRCIQLARGKWLGMIHGDDLIMDDHLRLMAKYINYADRGSKPLAYISPNYREFRDVGKISIVRKKYNRKLPHKDRVNLYPRYQGRLKRFYQLEALITGYSVGLPSFGTVMNREIMLKTGGFDEKLGICEDVITPYRLAKDYKVYETPLVMGYYRFEGNLSMKEETIFKICEAMCDFREYMYSRNTASEIWGWIARDIHFKNLRQYCSQLSRYSQKRLFEKDFMYIYPDLKTGKVKKAVTGAIYESVIAVYAALVYTATYRQTVEMLVKAIYPIIKMKRGDRKVVIYGAGRIGKNTASILKEKYGINTYCFAVTSAEDNPDKLMGIPVVGIDSLSENNDDYLIIISTTIIEYFDEMVAVLKKLKFKNVIKLCDFYK